MRLLKGLKQAEQKSLSAVRKHMERARGEWEDVERRIRQRMRIYPQKLKRAMAAARDDRPPEPDITDEGLPSGITGSAELPERPKPIVSIDGRDVDKDKPAA
jgi:hypothetical protein